jgi:hypothetical protein
MDLPAITEESWNRLPSSPEDGVPSFKAGVGEEAHREGAPHRLGKGVRDAEPSEIQVRIAEEV